MSYLIKKDNNIFVRFITYHEYLLRVPTRNTSFNDLLSRIHTALMEYWISCLFYYTVETQINRVHRHSMDNYNPKGILIYY